MTVSAEQKKLFDRRGFIVEREFFDRDAVATVSDWLDALQDPALKISEHAAKYFETSPLTGENILVRVEHILGDQDPEIAALLLNDKTLGALTELLGEAPVLFKEKINYKRPGCRADKLHQDQQAGWGAYSDFFVTMCIAIDPNREENAAVRFLNTGAYERKLLDEEWRPLSDETENIWASDEFDMIEANPGDVVFFDSYIPHGSPANTSNLQRRNLFLTFNGISAGDRRGQYYADKWKNYPPNDIDHAYSADSFKV